eukprot:6180046-Pleurochrysis_carterae.AAC.1
MKTMLLPFRSARRLHAALRIGPRQIGVAASCSYYSSVAAKLNAVACAGRRATQQDNDVAQLAWEPPEASSRSGKLKTADTR